MKSGERVIDARARAKELLRPFYLKWLYFHLSPSNRPTYFRECWNFPLEPAQLAKAAPREGVPPPLDFVFLPMSDWHTRIQRTQHLARTLAASGHRCVYLNPHVGREFPKPYPWSERRIVNRLEANVFELHVHLPREPVFHERCLTPPETRAILDAVLEILRGMGSKRAAVVVSLPTWTGVAEGLRAELQSPMVYDCHDWLSGFDRMARAIVEEENRLLEVADWVLFSSEWLARAHRNRGENLKNKSSILRNAVDASLFDFNAGEALPRPHGGPCIGYVGSLDSWFDAEAIGQAAALHPDWRFVLIGRSENRKIETLANYPNIKRLGELPHSSLPAQMAEFDVGIIPFLPQPLIDAVNPIKLYEYFACGMPVVAYDMPELQPYSSLLYLAADREQFLRHLESAVAETDPELRRERRQVAERESWRARSEELLKVIQRVTFPQAKPKT